MTPRRSRQSIRYVGGWDPRMEVFMGKSRRGLKRSFVDHSKRSRLSIRYVEKRERGTSSYDKEGYVRGWGLRRRCLYLFCDIKVL